MHSLVCYFVVSNCIQCPIPVGRVLLRKQQIRTYNRHPAFWTRSGVLGRGSSLRQGHHTMQSLLARCSNRPLLWETNMLSFLLRTASYTTMFLTFSRRSGIGSETIGWVHFRDSKPLWLGFLRDPEFGEDWAIDSFA